MCTVWNPSIKNQTNNKILENFIFGIQTASAVMSSAQQNAPGK